jgi:hypothetical protein
MKGICTAILVILFFRTNQLLEAQVATVKQPPPSANTQSDETYIMGRLQSALSSTQYGVRLYFHGACSAGSESALRFPSVDVLPPPDLSPPDKEQGVSAVREIFRNDKNVVVSVDSSQNVVRITIGNVYKSVLDTRIPSIKLTNTARYNPDGPGGAIDALEFAAPVQSAMRVLRMHQEPAFYIGLKQPSLPRSPHLPPSMRGLTFDQALDAIAKTFPGVVVYGECESHNKSHRIDIQFDWYPSK